MEDNQAKAMAAGKTAWWMMVYPSGKMLFADIKAEQLGYSAEGIDHYEFFTSKIHPDDYEQTMQVMRDHIAGDAPAYKTTYRIKAADGTYHTYMDQGVKQAGKNPGEYEIYGVTVDIT